MAYSSIGTLIIFSIILTGFSIHADENNEAHIDYCKSLHNLTAEEVNSIGEKKELSDSEKMNAFATCQLKQLKIISKDDSMSLLDTSEWLISPELHKYFSHCPKNHWSEKKQPKDFLNCFLKATTKNGKEIAKLVQAKLEAEKENFKDESTSRATEF